MPSLTLGPNFGDTHRNMDHRQSHASQLAKQRLERHSARAPVTMPFGQPWSRGDPEHEIQLWAPAEDPKSTTAGTDFREWPLKPAVNRPAAHEAGFADQRALTGASTAATSFPQWELPARRVAPAPVPRTQRQQQTGGDEWLTSSGETYVTHPIPASRGKARREFVQNEHAQGRRASTLQQVAAVDRFDGTTENTQNYVMHPLQSAAERQARGRAAAEAADQRGPLPHNVPFDSDTSYRTDFTPMPVQPPRGRAEPPPRGESPPLNTRSTAHEDFRKWPLKPAVNRPAAHEAGFADQRALTGASTAATSFPQWELPARRVAPAPVPRTQRQQQTGGDEWLTSSGETYVTHPIPASRGKARREFVQNEHAQGRRASTLQQVAAVDRFDGTTENTQNYVMHPLQSAAERQARGRAAAEAADQRGPLPHNVPFDSDTSYRTDFTPMRRDVAVPVGTPLALGVQLQSHGGATFYCMLTPRMQSSSAKVTTVTHGQRAVQVRVVASPAVSAVHQMVTVESPLLLLDEFELPGVAPAPAGTAELLLTFELARRDAGKSLLTVTCADMRNAGGEKNISIALHQSGAPQQS